MNDNQDTSHTPDTSVNDNASATDATSHTPAAPTAPSAVVAGLIVDELLRLGMVDAVVCPGSRSAPLARALVQAADAAKVRLHVRIDERSAAFLALGLASRTRKVTPVITTSGTAVANLVPAMVEATASGIPLLALTADRPAHYRGTGANQTIVQDRLFADASVVEFDLDGTAPVTKATAAQIRARIDRVVAAMASGAGHLNVRFVEPLVPDDDSVADIPEGRADGGPWTTIAPTNSNNVGVAATATGPANAASTATIDISRRTLVIAGSNAPHLPALEDLPTIAEPNAYAPAHPVHPLAAGTFAQIPPEQIVLVGRPTLHRGISKLLANPDIELTVVSEAENHGFGVEFPDVTANARAVVRHVQTVGEQDPQWTKICEAASELAVKSVRETLTESIEAEEPLTGFHVAAALTDSLRTGDNVVLGASNPVRDASYTGLPFPGVNTYAGRGAAGIDGTVATAIGIALASDREHADEIRPPRTIALMGDLTFQHDSAALAIGPLEPRPENLTIVVANDAGGGIFETLEAGSPVLRGSFERIFGTPQGVDFEGICQAYGVEHVRVDRLPDLLAQLHPDTDVDGIRVIEVATTRATRRQLHHKLAYNAEIGVLDKH
ncbi:2-succinyl-5-enolpyruvyl-6-hydroxy-3-cyclohexene-1-carboxylate synthase [Corynebacterium sp. HMSC063G05]|uniref:2-succinyl-5-enolpyruvyl-6-hydroxy-3- cyclohexene-1-carboxylic-acid synthase n=1 Tax=Corynebacterium TaxID=1716 RepID=UPI0008B060D2|nr:2-succinyl-5-enolpyruvyl-6-hydroxy-3-cyclohexene-1-carboxylate synthase [Corynebacterium sp. HMSC063G05]OFM52684.1 2-succinyl-5-enolpyruvyl-6-hydroxy-3-cyclohexene-1-carboxylate synthase [Corynebacterium sp. HMSC064H12]OFN36955.1 2-succinyl-5-enolpyruvyl-6-hydroxy-3-cyclohexene-1-carboxylate synthase [Corynebacterium sp. HMSC077G07]OFQ02877.1 2-succinyl-5-enolpyruvyl-6-hydroxy-3-cyclohexene-1-carboxylate synthase [Corynebacterium sp. HMSC070B05]